MSTHYKTVCSRCDALMGQCRCPGPKQIRFSLCNSCKAMEVKTVNKTLEYDPAELVWILTALEDMPSTYIFFKTQYQSDLYYVTLEMSTYAMLRSKLADVRRVFFALFVTANTINVPNIEDTCGYLMHSLDSIIQKVEALFDA